MSFGEENVDGAPGMDAPLAARSPGDPKGQAVVHPRTEGRLEAACEGQIDLTLRISRRRLLQAAPRGLQKHQAAAWPDDRIDPQIPLANGAVQ
jgi:hypothetical protein